MFKMRKINIIGLSLIFLFFFNISTVSIMYSWDENPVNNNVLVTDEKELKLSSLTYANVTILSDNETDWNDDQCFDPNIAIDNNGTIHVVWHDDADGPWKDDPDYDEEIFYRSYKEGIGWSSASVVSDNGAFLNTNLSRGPDIAIDNNGKIHVVWYDLTHGSWSNGYHETEIMYSSSTDGILWSNTVVISDNTSVWNDGDSSRPVIDIDPTGRIHVIWYDLTDGPWGTDTEIMHTSSIDGIIWTNIKILSDDNTNWNKGASVRPDIVIDSSGRFHVVWQDETNGTWGNDTEIMYISSSDGIIWSNASVISDGSDNYYWNDGLSQKPKIAVDNSGNIHVVWDDDSNGFWKDTTFENEIFYVSSADGILWSNITVISDDNNHWNDRYSRGPAIAVDNFGKVHVVWTDYTIGYWSNDPITDSEIMYVSYFEGIGWSNITVISDGSGGYYWNDHGSLEVEIAVNESCYAHVVWRDYSSGIWNTGGTFDSEVMYTSFISDDLAPRIIEPVDPFVIHYEEDMIGNEFLIIVDDIYPNYYTINRGPTLIDNGTWVSNDPILLNVDGLSSGSYLYEILFTDLAQNTTSMSIDVIVSEALPPDLLIPPEKSYKEGDVGNYINWAGMDLYPGSYIISRNGSTIDSGQWTHATVYSLPIDDLSPGIHIYTINISDQAGHYKSDTVKVTVLPLRNIDIGIPFGETWILVGIISIIGLCIYVKKKL